MAQETHDHDAAMYEILAAMETQPMKVEAFSGMFYGPSGSGKTVLAVALGSVLNFANEKTLIVDTSRGYVSLANHDVLSDTFQIVPFKDMASLETLAIMFEKNHPSVAHIGTLVFDEISKMVRLDTDEIAVSKHHDVPEWPDYNLALNRVRHVIYRIMRRTDLNFIMVAHERDKKNKTGDVVFTHPDFIPSIVKELKEDIHVVARVTAAAVNRPGQDPEYKRLIQAMPTATIDAKCRMTPLPVLVTPDHFIEHTKDWLARGGRIQDDPGIQADESIVDMEIPSELRQIAADSEPEPDDSVWNG